MPVEFLTDEQAEAYGRFAEEPTRPELERFFFLDDEDRNLIAKRRGDHNRLGFALQMCTVRYIGLFLEDPSAVPWPVVEHLAEQLEIEDPSCLKEYTERPKTAYEHSWEIRNAYGYHQYEDPAHGRMFRSFLHGRAWTHAEGPVTLFNHTAGWLRRHRVLLPGVNVLARQVSEVRTIAEKRLHATVAKAALRADPALPRDLVATLKTPAGTRYSELERMRRPPTRTTGTAMKGALQRVEDIAAFELGRLKLQQIPPNRLSALARYGLGTKAPKLERTAEPKRTAILTAVMRHLEAKAIDDALDLFEILMATRLISTAKRSTDKQRLSTLPQLEKASRIVARAAKVFIEKLESIEEALSCFKSSPGATGTARTGRKYSNTGIGCWRPSAPESTRPPSESSCWTSQMPWTPRARPGPRDFPGSDIEGEGKVRRFAAISPRQHSRRVDHQPPGLASGQAGIPRAVPGGCQQLLSFQLFPALWTW